MKAIWAEGLSQEKNVTISFQLRLQVQKPLTLRMAASNLYRLFVNGDLIGYGPARAAEGYARVDEYIIPEAEETFLSVDVYSAQINSYYHMEEAPFFAAEIFADGQLIAEASDFTAYFRKERVQKVRRFSFQRTFSEVYHFTEDPARVCKGEREGDCPVKTLEVPLPKLLERGVPYPKLDRVPAQEIAGGEFESHMDDSEINSDDPFADIRKAVRDRAYAAIDQVKLKGFLPSELTEDPSAVIETYRYREMPGQPGPALAEGQYRLYDFSRTVTGFFSWHMTVEEAAEVYITFDEVLASNGMVDPFRNTCSNVITYTLAPGEYHLTAFEANSARYTALLVAKGKVCADTPGMILYENPEIEAFESHYEDPDWNLITKAAAHTLAQNGVDILMDCPSRERAGWLCDSYFSSRAEAFFTGQNKVEHNFLENYALCPPSPYLPKDMIPMCYPSDHNDGIYIPNWAMWYILELKNYAERTGDTKMLEQSRDKVYGLVRFFKAYENENGLLEDLDSWVFLEWSACNDADHTCGVNYPSNMLWAAALEAAGEMYGEPSWKEKAAAMKSKIRQLAWDGSFFVDNAVRNETGMLVNTGLLTETAQYYAFYFGIADAETYPDLFSLLRTRFGPSRDTTTVYPDVAPSNAIVGNYLRLELLIRYGFYDQCLEECRAFFLNMAQMTGTLWEHSRLSSSLNHGFASMAAVYIAQCLKAQNDK